MADIVFSPIGIIHSPHESVSGMPIQGRGAMGVAGRVEVFPEYADGLKDLAGFSHIYLFYLFHLASPPKLRVVPFLDSEPRGVFATRVPSRPNGLGLSIVRLTGVTGNILTVENVDIVNGTPLIDIKPYVPAFDHWEVDRVGWLEGRGGRVPATRSDERFGKL